MKSDTDDMGIVGAVMTELVRAEGLYPPMRSAHEGYAVLLEEVRELEREVFWGTADGRRREAIQVAAMAMRFLADICEREAAEPALPRLL